MDKCFQLILIQCTVYVYMPMQWFIDTRVVGELACKAVKDGDLRLDPPTYNAVWDNFLSQEKNRWGTPCLPHN